MQAMIRTAPPQAAQVWMSMPNTRWYRQVNSAKLVESVDEYL
jgi:hypothetical protein